jgi:uncharacterized protein YbjQ (UPF0145 family)
MILTTTNNIEGFKILEYKGIVTGTSAELKTKFSFKTEKNMQMFEDLMDEAKEEAFRKLKLNATHMSANAVVGISLDIETEAGSYFFVSVIGTAVIVAV